MARFVRGDWRDSEREVGRDRQLKLFALGLLDGVAVPRAGSKQGEGGKGGTGFNPSTAMGTGKRHRALVWKPARETQMARLKQR